ncbi:MAG TPA: peptidoglycan DD-metalloendopeptidase family protein [Gammaproteobacteria bacterium]|nr:peptidoglycan DD-metalloendopeptidase family protein [Gammaproteobacteria bacterium]
MKRLLHYASLLLCILVLAGCAGALNWKPLPPGAALAESEPTAEPVPASYTVSPGDTLYSIAWRYGLDYHDVARWNGIGSDYLIRPGQNLRLSAPVGSIRRTPSATARVAAANAGTARSASVDDSFTPPSGGIVWRWPADGRVIRQYHAGDALSKGMDISATRGADIRAAAAGKVVYAGSGIIGYGKLIIIKNSEQFLSAYADNDEILVKEGDVVQAGDRIAEMGLGRDGHPLLHFEIRHNGKPVDPMQYLPRSH